VRLRNGQSQGLASTAARWLDLSTALSCRAPLRIFHFAEVKNYEPNPNP
jgi:hypothetical protein